LCGILISFYDGVKGGRHFVQKSKGGILRCYTTALHQIPSDYPGLVVAAVLVQNMLE